MSLPDWRAPAQARARQRAAIGGAFARALGRGCGVWSCFDSGTSARSGMAAGPRIAAGCSRARARQMTAQGWARACRARCGCWTRRCRLADAGLILEQGPERIESGWWDGKGVARDYYIARQISGDAPVAGRKALGFPGTSIQALVSARDVRVNGARAQTRLVLVYAELHALSNFSFLRGASQP